MISPPHVFQIHDGTAAGGVENNSVINGVTTDCIEGRGQFSANANGVPNCALEGETLMQDGGEVAGRGRAGGGVRQRKGVAERNE